MLFGPGGRHADMLPPDWASGGAAGAFLNMVMFAVLHAIFGQRSSGLGLWIAMTLCVLSLLMAPMAMVA